MAQLEKFIMTDGTVVPLEIGGSGGAKGKQLLVEYTHSGNQEFHISSIDTTTGHITLTEPHGLTADTNVLLVTNTFDIDNIEQEFAGVCTKIPVEYMYTSTKGILTIVDENTVIYNGITTIDTTSEFNNDIDLTSFHFEIPANFEITDIDAVKKVRAIDVCFRMLSNASWNFYPQVTFKNAVTNSVYGFFYQNYNAIRTLNSGGGRAFLFFKTIISWSIDELYFSSRIKHHDIYRQHDNKKNYQQIYTFNANNATFEFYTRPNKGAIENPVVYAIKGQTSYNVAMANGSKILIYEGDETYV